MDRAHSRVGRPLQPGLYVLGRGAQFYEGRPLPSPSPAGKHQCFHAETQVPETSPQGAGPGQPQGGPGGLGGKRDFLQISVCLKVAQALSSGWEGTTQQHGPTSRGNDSQDVDARSAGEAADLSGERTEESRWDQGWAGRSQTTKAQSVKAGTGRHHLTEI